MERVNGQSHGMDGQGGDGRPRVSVIVPVYNTAARLPACLESLRTQDLADVEFILVDDGSTDGSLAICRDFAAKDARFRVLTGPNGGVCVARNRGLDVARGDWIAFCDSDDRVDPAIYATLLALAERERADLASCALRDIGPTEMKPCVLDFPIAGTTETLRGRDAILSRVFYPLLNDSRAVHGYLFVCLFRRDLIEARKIRFRPGITMCEDEMFILDCLLSVTALAVVRQPLYDYLRFETSACTTYYRREGDWKRERNWFLRAQEKLRIFTAGGLADADPATAQRLAFLVFYHEAQAICCDPSLSWGQRRRALADLRTRFRRERIAAVGRGAKLFAATLTRALPLLPLLLWAKRRADEIKRRIENDGC